MVGVSVLWWVSRFYYRYYIEDFLTAFKPPEEKSRDIHIA